jgi:hypothetical protein
MEILRALERGDIDVSTATERLAAVDDGGDDVPPRTALHQPDDVSQFGGRT